MTIHFSWVHLVSLTVSIAQCWSRLAVTADWGHHLLLKAIKHGSSLPSAAAKPCHGVCGFGREAAGHSPLFPTAGGPSKLSLFMVSPNCHHSLMPSAPSSWRPAGSTNYEQHCEHCEHCEHGWILGWRHKGKAFDGVKNLVLTQGKPVAGSQCWCHSPEHSLCEATHAWHPQTPVPWAGRAWALHLQLQAGGWAMPGKAPGWGLTQCCQAAEGLPRVTFVPRAETEQLLQLCSPYNCPNNWSPSPTPPLQVKLYTQLIAQDICDGGLSIYRHLTGSHVTGTSILSGSLSTGYMRGKCTAFVHKAEGHLCRHWENVPLYEMHLKTEFGKGTKQEWHILKRITRERGSYLGVWIETIQ